MYEANTKMTANMSVWRKEWMDTLPKGSQFAVTDCGVTVLSVPDGVVTKFTTSIMSGDEKKFRRKVGEYHALERYMDGEFMVLPRDLFSNAEFFVENTFQGAFMHTDEEGTPMIRNI